MIMWRKLYPRVVYQPVIAIHGVYYVVKDEVIFKRHLCEWVLPQAVARHIRYNPRHCPVPLDSSSNPHSVLISVLNNKPTWRNR